MEKSLKYNKVKVVRNLLKILLYSLLLFGTGFSKLQVVGPLYLHDLSLLFLVIISLFFYKVPLSQKPILILFFISIIYLLGAFVIGNPLFYVLRQYILFFYMISIYFVFHVINRDHLEFLKMLKTLSKVAVLIQFIYMLYIAFIVNKNIFSGYGYFSPLVVMLFPVYVADILSRHTSKFKKAALFFVILLFSTTLGHTSIFLAILIVGFIYFLFLITKKQINILLSILASLLIILFLTLPQFNDANASWRLIYWWMGIQGGTNNFLLGNGFGVPYIKQEQIEYFIEVFNHSNDFLKDPSEVYFIAFHNSFITIFYHIGIFILLLITPYFQIFKKINNKNYTDEQLFLMLSLAGITVWSCFNVILELPHSAILFWIIYFATSESLKFINEKK